MGLFGLGKKKKEESSINELNPIKDSIEGQNSNNPVPNFQNPFNQEQKQTPPISINSDNNTNPPNKINNSNIPDSSNLFNQEPKSENMPPIPSPPDSSIHSNNQESSFLNEIPEINQQTITQNNTAPEIPPIAEEIKQPANSETLEKKDADITKTKGDINYLDEILDKNMDLNSDQIKEEIIIKETPKHNKEEIPIKQEETGKEEKQIIVKKIKNEEELPKFLEEEKKLEMKTKEITEKFKSRQEITGDIFIKAPYYKEILYTCVNIKEDIKNSIEKIEDIKNTIESESKTDDKIKNNLETINDDLMLIEKKLFENNPYLR